VVAAFKWLALVMAFTAFSQVAGDEPPLRFAVVSLEWDPGPVTISFGGASPMLTVNTEPRSGASSSTPASEKSLALPSPPRLPSGDRRFWAYGTMQNARLLATTKHTEIWVEDVPELAHLDPSAFASAAEAAYDATIPRFGNLAYAASAIADNRAPYCNTDGSRTSYGRRIVNSRGGRAVILLDLNWDHKSEYADTFSYVPQPALNCFAPHLKSNGLPGIIVVLLDVHDLRRPEAMTYLTWDIGHELQHLANFIRHSVTYVDYRYDTAGLLQDFPSIDEGLSQLAEDYVANALDGSAYALTNLHWVEDFVANPQLTTVIGIDQDDRGALGDGSYGGAYLFQRYLNDRFGEVYLRRLVTSTKVGPQELNQLTGVPYDQLVADFARAIGGTGCTTKTAFCALLRAVRADGKAIEFHPIPADGRVTVPGGSISFWETNAKSIPPVSASGSDGVLTIPIRE
jgi:hypothetical protein